MKFKLDGANKSKDFDQFASLIQTLEIEEIRPFAPDPTPQFKNKLHQSLIFLHEKQSKALFNIWQLGQLTGSLVALIILILSITAIWFTLAQQTTQINDNKSNDVIIPDRNQVIYDLLALSWTTRDGAAVTLRAESWQTTNGDIFRGQITDIDGNLVYFVQSDGEQLWRTYQADPEIGWGTTPITKVYQMSLEDLLLPQEFVPLWVIKPPFFSGLNWEWVPSVMLQIRPECADLLCVLQQIYPEPEATCTLTECVFYGGAFTRSVANLGNEVMDNGRIISTLEIGEEREIKIDAETYALIAASEPGNESGNQFRFIEHLERQISSINTFPSSFFSTLPDSLQTVPWVPPATAKDSAWLISSTPLPGSLISDQIDTSTNFTLEIGYELATVPEALLQVELVPQSTTDSDLFQMETAVNSTWIPISAAQQSVTVEMQLPPMQGNTALPLLVPVVTLILRDPMTSYFFYREPLVDSAWGLFENGIISNNPSPQTTTTRDEMVNSVTVIDFSPPTSTQLFGSDPIDFSVTVAYHLESVANAEIHVSMMPADGGESLVTAVIPITIGEGQRTIPFTFNPLTDLNSSRPKWIMSIQMFTQTEDGLIGLAGASPHTLLEDSWYFEP
jgi:hypothetical protein